MKISNLSCGFTLIELLVSISIIGILIGLSIFALAGVRGGARDTQRRGDLEKIRASLETYRADCGKYPASLPAPGDSNQTVTGDGSSTSCAPANVYLTEMPKDPTGQYYKYYYARGSSTTTYMLCAHLERSSGDATGCGQCSPGIDGSCNYKTTNP